MIKKLAALMMSAVALSSICELNAKAFSVDQIQSEMPEITIYANSDSDISRDSIEILLDYKPIKVASVERFSESGDTVNYYFLIDDSGSVPSDQMRAVKELLGSLDSYVSSDDSVKLISIGTLETLYSGIGINENFQTAVNSISNINQETFLYESLKKVGDLISEKEVGGNARDVVIVFSDGFDEALGKSSFEEISGLFTEAGIPIYAMGIKTSDTSGLEELGELVRTTGGELYAIDADNCSEVYDSLSERIRNCYRVSALAENNIISGKRSLTINCSEEGYSKEFSIDPHKWIPDNTPPEMISFEKIADNQIEVGFSEPVLNADDIGNYDLHDALRSIELKSASYREDEGEYTAVITASEAFYSGDYTLSVSGIYDKSNEKNSVENEISATIYGRLDASSLSDNSHDAHFQSVWLWIVLGLIVLFALGVVIFVLKKRSYDKGSALEESVPDTERVIESVVARKSTNNVKHHVLSGSVRSGVITISVIGDNKETHELRLAVEDSISVGRSQKNDVYFDDVNMSRYHFSILHINDAYYLKDNGSTSGTYLNGEKLGEERIALSQGDVISAGKTRMSVRW